MLDVFVGESFAARALREADTFAERSIICFAVCRVQIRELVAAFYANGHVGQGRNMWIGKAIGRCLRWEDC